MQNWMWILIILLSACTPGARNQERLKSLVLAECADERAGQGRFNRNKSHALLLKECEQMYWMDERYRPLARTKIRSNPRLTAQQDQEYVNEEAWFLVTKRIREIYYPSILDPESEVLRADWLNEQEVKRQDRSIQRHYEPRLIPVSPYLMSYWELDMAGIALDQLIHEHWQNTALRRSLSSISLIVIKEKSKRQLR